MARKEKPMNGLRVDVRNNNIEFALKKFKRMVRDSELMVELRNRSFYEKPSMVKREKKNLQKSRHKYEQKKNNNKDF
jgi:ribosomal protein S21|tara:strand:+ start:820 stop:1050 length:231 start_codon:yes stop_codon:yes gene_type:complete